MGKEGRYRRAASDGGLAQRVAEAAQGLSACQLCPRRCGVDRLTDARGVCRTGGKAVVASYGAHFGEEAPLVGSGGSGTIFFTYCNLLCSFCQNYDTSHLGAGTEVTEEHLAHIMLSLQFQGCANINLVTPSHVVPQILGAVQHAADQGLHVPLVYNTSGYDAVETLRLLDGIVDIYMPDFKFWDPEVALRVAKAPDYPGVARQAVKEMHRQVGDLVIGEDGLAVSGLLVRHLVMPEDAAGTREVMRFLATEVSRDTYVNLMAQYHPCGRAAEDPHLARRPTRAELSAGWDAAREAGITRLDRPDQPWLGF